MSVVVIVIAQIANLEDKINMLLHKYDIKCEIFEIVED